MIMMKCDNRRALRYWDVQGCGALDKDAREGGGLIVCVIMLRILNVSELLYYQLLTIIIIIIVILFVNVIV